MKTFLNFLFYTQKCDCQVLNRQEKDFRILNERLWCFLRSLSILGALDDSCV